MRGMITYVISLTITAVRISVRSSMGLLPMLLPEQHQDQSDQRVDRKPGDRDHLVAGAAQAPRAWKAA